MGCGNGAGPGPSYFTACASIGHSGDVSGMSGGLKGERYVNVPAGNFGGTILTTSYNGNCSISGTGNYNWVGYDLGGYASGQTASIWAGAGYTNWSWTTYESGYTASYTVPIATHTVAFNANGGTGAPASFTKSYGTVASIPTTKPTRSGYSFQGWATTATGSVVYSAGGQYSADQGGGTVTLYAVGKLSGNTITAYDSSGNKRTGLVTGYDSSGAAHTTLISGYDSSGAKHNVQ